MITNKAITYIARLRTNRSATTIKSASKLQIANIQTEENSAPVYCATNDDPERYTGNDTHRSCSRSPNNCVVLLGSPWASVINRIIANCKPNPNQNPTKDCHKFRNSYIRFLTSECTRYTKSIATATATMLGKNNRCVCRPIPATNPEISHLYFQLDCIAYANNTVNTGNSVIAHPNR